MSRRSEAVPLHPYTSNRLQRTEVDGEVRYHDGTVEGEFQAGYSLKTGLSGRREINTEYENTQSGGHVENMRSDQGDSPMPYDEKADRYPHRY